MPNLASTTSDSKSLLQFTASVREALENGKPVVALESTIIAHGLPHPANLACVDQLSSIIESQGATPALIALGEGKIHIGLEGENLEKLALGGEAIAKVSPRDFGVVLVGGGWGATTVAGTVRAAAMAGIKVFATGGIGGVHRGAETSFDISADLQAMANNPVAVVSAGAKSILDLPKTMEALESYGVPVWGYQADEFPAFYTRQSGLALEHSFQNATDLAKAISIHAITNPTVGTLIANPIRHEDALDATEEKALIERAMDAADMAGIRGKATTPFVLGWLHENSDGKTVKANLALVENNAKLAADIAVSLAQI